MVFRVREKSISFPVAMARGSHLFPFRTQKLSLFAPKVLGWTRPGRLGRCRNPYQETRCVSFFYWIGDSLSLQGWEPPCSEGGHHVPVREAHGRNMIAEAACSRSWRRTRRRCGCDGRGLPPLPASPRKCDMLNLAAQGFRTRRACRRVRMALGGPKPSKPPQGVFRQAIIHFAIAVVSFQRERKDGESGGARTITG